MIPSGFVLNEELAALFHQMEFAGESLFVTGRAGTGKSTLLNYFRKNTLRKHVVLAPTGLAALQVGGSTIHSFFGLPLRPLLKNDPEIRAWGRGHPRLKIVRKMDTLVIDEVSMVRADVLEAIDQSLRLNMKTDTPFGGKQIILIGDIFQLPPVVNQATEMRVDDEDPYYSPYFFSSDAFWQCRPKVVQLNHVFRQADESFIYLLNRIRTGIAGPEDLDELNSRFDPNPVNDEFTVMLTSVNTLADLENQRRLMELPGSIFTYKGTVEGNFPQRIFPVPAILQLKRSAQVMMVRNDLQGRWVNGSIGVVDELSDNEIIVRFPNGDRHAIDPLVWENKNYAWDRSSNNVTFNIEGTYRQYPIKLAWAMTIHKSQGLTFDRVVIDVGRGAFAHGQLYVALSRCRTLNGITLKTPLRTSDIIVDEAVEYFAGRVGLT